MQFSRASFSINKTAKWAAADYFRDGPTAGLTHGASAAYHTAMLDTPTLIEGGNFADDRGLLSFVNDFTFEGVKRFYQVINRQPNFVRAWQGHYRGGRYIYAAAGSALVAAVKMPRPGQSSLAATPEKFFLTAAQPAVLWIPPGYANGWMNIGLDACLFFFSTSTLEENKNDDFRFPSDQLDIWKTGLDDLNGLCKSQKL